MILTCAQCGRQYDAAGQPAGQAIRCGCGDLLPILEPEAFEEPHVVAAFVARWAGECGTTAEALAVAEGWEFLAGSAAVRIRHDQRSAALHIQSALFAIPLGDERRRALFQRLLELNAGATDQARFAVADGQVQVVFQRPTLGLDYFEFRRAVETVAEVADDFDDELREAFLQEVDEVDRAEESGEEEPEGGPPQGKNAKKSD